MGSEWPIVALGDVAEDLTVGYVGPMASEYVPTGIPFLRSQNIERFRINLTDTKFITPEFHAQLRKSSLQPGDVVIVRTGKPGTAAVIPESMSNLNCSDLVIVRPGIRIDSRFLCYFINSVAETHVSAHLVGAVQQHINVGSARQLPLRLPPLPEQRAIAHILGTLDDKIELNRRTSETLEAMARALFKSWFVDFDPVRAKAEGRWKRGQSLPGLPAHLFDLFPSSFVDSELGEIPKGWSVGALSNISALNPEVWTRETRPSEIRYVDLTNTKWGRIESVTSYSAIDAPSRAQRVLRDGDTIIGTVRPGNGSYTLVSDDGLTGSTGFAVLRPNLPDFKEFVYLAATCRDNIDILTHLADGGAYPAVRPEVVLATSVALPEIGLIRVFSRLAGVQMNKIACIEHEASNLAVLRDTLLPKLISGEVRVGADSCDERERVET